MRIIAPTDGTVSAERRLAALMLNIEHAGLVFGPDLVKLPEPHVPWPCVELKPITQQGLPSWAHYMATVGVVFYTAGAALDVRALVRRISALLDSTPADHLKRHHAVAATPSAVLRHKGRVVGGTQIVGPRKCYRKKLPEWGSVPARLLLWTPPSENELPPHYSIRAAFTWVFMPVTAALAVQHISSTASANAMIASVLYDVGMLARVQEDTDFYRLSLGDFNVPPLPEFLRPPALSPPIVVTGPGLPQARTPVPNTGALVVRGDALAYVGQHEYLRARPRPYGHLPHQPWAPDSYFALGPGRYQCCGCGAPVGGGDVIVVRAPLVPPATNSHQEWWYHPRPHGSPILPGDAADKSLLLCLTCWNALDSSECLTHHMRATVTRATAPHTQAQACAQCPGYGELARLLAGSVRGSETKGAFIVKMADGSELVLAGDSLGPLPALTDPEIASLGLPVLAGLRLAEDPGGAAGEPLTELRLRRHDPSSP